MVPNDDSNRIVCIGTRGSQLALWQAHYVRDALKRAFPNGEVIEEIIHTTGDLRREESLVNLWGRGVFTRELDAALLDGRVDLAVHSAKDYPTEVDPGVAILAYPTRWIPNDSLVARNGERLAELPPGALVGTGSQRRSAQLLRMRPDLRFAEIRGNIETRLRKVTEGQYDAVLMAEAALRRMGLDDVKREMLPVTRLVPAAGQGALMIVGRGGDARIARLLKRIDDVAVHRCVTAERAVLIGLGGGCRLPFGVHARIAGDVMKLRAIVVSPDATKKATVLIEGPAAKPLQVARAAVTRLFDRGAREIIAEIEGM
jgi:hydroxymethylbilane synthase